MFFGKQSRMFTFLPEMTNIESTWSEIDFFSKTRNSLFGLKFKKKIDHTGHKLICIQKI